MSLKLAPPSQPELPELAQSQPSTKLTTSFSRNQSSKVWPLQPSQLGVQPTSIGKLPDAPWLDELDCAEFESETRRTKTFCERVARLNQQLKLSRRLFSQDFAEVCFVGGYITALIGSLVAISGIFTRNQARTRLYMEGFGCGMVILGVLVVFISLRMRASKGSELAQLRRLFQSSRDDIQRKLAANQIATAHKRVATCLVPNGLASFGATPDLVLSHSPTPTPPRLTPTLLLDHRPMFDDEEQAPTVVGLQVDGRPVETAATEGHVVLPSGTHFELIEYESATGHLTVSSGLPTPVSDEDEEDLSLAGCSRQLSLWTPCTNQPDDWSYPNDLHDAAAIEAALSIVLTVATLAGFRPDGAEMKLRPGVDRHEHFCCLHHTVQRKLQARKWVTRSRGHNKQARSGTS